MIQCRNCEFCRVGPSGQLSFSCDPFGNVKEPECVNKWLLLKMDLMVRAYQATLEYYRRLAPLQERMFKHVERELNDMDESDKWKISDEDQDQDQDQDKDKDQDQENTGFDVRQ